MKPNISIRTKVILKNDIRKFVEMIRRLHFDLEWYFSNLGLPCDRGRMHNIIHHFHAQTYPDGVYSDVNFHITIERRSLFYTLNLILPVFLITFLAVMTFILPSQSGERMGVSLTLMLTVTVFMLLIAEMIPESSKSVAVVEVWNDNMFYVTRPPGEGVDSRIYEQYFWLTNDGGIVGFMILWTWFFFRFHLYSRTKNTNCFHERHLESLLETLKIFWRHMT